MKLIIVFCCIIGFICANRGSNATLSGSAQEALKTTKNLLVAYDRSFKLCAPLTKFHQKLQDYTHSRKGLSPSGGQLLGQLTTMLLNVDSDFFHAKQALNGLCGESGPLLDGYVLMFEGYGPDNANAQKELLQNVLQTAEEKSGEAMRGLDQTISKFTAASNKLNDLIVQLTIDFKEDSDFFKSEFESVRAELVLTAIQQAAPAPRSRSKNQVQNPPTGPSNAEIVAQVKKNFAEVKQLYVNLMNEMEAEKSNIADIENNLKSRTGAVTSSKARVSANGVIVQADEIPAINNLINGFKNKCTDIRASNRQQ